MPIVDIFQENATVHLYSLFNYVEDSKLQAEGTAFVYDALADGSLVPNIDRVYPMEGYREAWDYFSQPRTKTGKVMIETGL